MWNDVFMARTDLPRGYGGWQVLKNKRGKRTADDIPDFYLIRFNHFLQAIDATPQEKSNSKIIWFSDPNGSSIASIFYLKPNKKNLTVEIYHVWPLIAP